MVLLGLVVGLGLGCGARRSQSASAPFVVGALGSGWESASAGGADLAWYNASLMATIYADANCKKRRDDSTLSDSMHHLTAGLRAGAPLREEALRLANRDALLRVYEVTLDGVPLTLGAVVLNKDDCSYDMVYLAPRLRFDAGWADFVGLVSGFEGR
ncbi:MAG: hypothetical protein ACI8S6_005598 [Myxococcota bacterium]|jgi:hypothetical protein